MARKAEVRYVNFYTAGSAAYKYDPPLPQQHKEVKQARPRRQKKILIYVDPVATVGICLAVVMLIMMIVGLFQLGAAQKQANQMQAYVAQLEQRNAQLDAQYRAGYDLEEIRQIATAMGMIPMEQAQQVQISAAVPKMEEEPSAWESFCTFLAGLFA